MKRSALSLSVFTSLLAFSLIVVAAHAVLAQSTTLDPAVQAALTEGKKFEQRNQLTSALDSDRKALKIAKGTCGECYNAITNLQLTMELPKDAAASAASWVAHTSNPIEKSHAEYTQALALMRFNSQKPNPALLHQADEVLKRAAIDNPADPAIHMLHGRVLAALNLDAAAKAEFVACTATPGASPTDCMRANNFASDINLARGEAAPAFSIAGPNDTPVTLDSFAGKVVLIDFWATWCPPCDRDLDYIQSIAEEFRKDNFVLLGISSDSGESEWKHYIDKHRMLGVQVRDSTHGMRDLFHVAEIPTYIVIDANGMVRLRVIGTRGDIRGKVRSLVAKPSAIAEAPSQPHQATSLP